jgi:hypothetical protein
VSYQTWLTMLEKSLDNASEYLRKGDDEGLLRTLQRAGRYVRQVREAAPSLQKSQLLRRFTSLCTLEGQPLNKGLTGSIGKKQLGKPDPGMSALTKKGASGKKPERKKLANKGPKLMIGTAGKLSTGHESTGSKLKAGSPTKLSGTKKSMARGIAPAGSMKDGDDLNYPHPVFSAAPRPRLGASAPKKVQRMANRIAVKHAAAEKDLHETQNAAYRGAILSGQSRGVAARQAQIVGRIRSAKNPVAVPKQHFDSQSDSSFGPSVKVTAKSLRSSEMSYRLFLEDLRKSGPNESGPSLKPPKGWWDKMSAKISSGNPHYSAAQVRGTVGKIWYKQMSGKSRAIKRKAEGKKYGKAPVA